MVRDKLIGAQQRTNRILAIEGFMRIAAGISVVLFVAAIAACSSKKPPQDSNSPAYQAGKAAHGLAKETGKVAEKAARALREGAKEAHEGWKEAAREDREKRAKAAKDAKKQ